MIDRVQYGPVPASAKQCRLFWSDQVDALDGHLSGNRWALMAIMVVLIAYPIARMAIPAITHAIVPEVVRMVLNIV